MEGVESSEFGRPVRWSVDAWVYFGGIGPGFEDGFRACVAAVACGAVDVVASETGVRASFELDGRSRDDVAARASEITNDAMRAGAAAMPDPAPGPHGWSLSIAATPPPPRYRIMGILNVTPDSFSDGGRYVDVAAAVAHGVEMVEAGAAIIDVGGESTRPGAAPVEAAEELRRVVPVIEGLISAGVAATISIDTSKASVAHAALEAGARFVNDVTALRADPAMGALVARWGVPCCLTHMQGDPATMQAAPHYADVVAEVGAFLRERADAAVAAGIARERVLIDPGIGFGKTVAHNLELLERLGELLALGRPILIGTSRKSFLGALTGREHRDRLASTIATNVIALLHGATVFRVHDVAPVRDALEVAAATVSAR